MLGNQVGDDFRMLRGNIGGFAIILTKIKKLPIRRGWRKISWHALSFLRRLALTHRNEMPLGGPDARLGILSDFGVDPLDHTTPATYVGEKRPVWPGNILTDLSTQQRRQTPTFHLSPHLLRGWSTGELKYRRRKVNVSGERFDISRLEMSRPAPEGHRPNAPHVGRTLRTAHARIKNRYARRAAIVVHEDHQGVLGDAHRFDFGHQQADVQVEVMNHPEEVFHVGTQPLPLVECSIRGPRIIRGVRHVSCDVCVERPLSCDLAFNPFRGLTEEHVGAVAGGFLEPAVMEERRAEVRIAWYIATAPRVTLTNTAGTMDVNFVEPTLVRLILSLVP